jgi:hypothetical protein
MILRPSLSLENNFGCRITDCPRAGDAAGLNREAARAITIRVFSDRRPVPVLRCESDDVYDPRIPRPPSFG